MYTDWSTHKKNEFKKNNTFDLDILSSCDDSWPCKFTKLQITIQKSNPSLINKNFSDRE